MELPLVSIGIPTYNRPEGLRKLLDSMLNQSYKNIELIVSDNATPGNVVDDLVNEYRNKDPRVKFFKQPVNIGALPNFSFVLEQATGKYFMWAADDDDFSPITIERSVNGFLQNSTAVLSSLQCNIIDLRDNAVAQPKFLPDTIGCTNKIKFRKVIDYTFNEINVFFYSLMELEALKKCRSYTAQVFGADVFLVIELLEFGDLYIDSSAIGLTSYLHPQQASVSMESYIKVMSRNSSFWDRNLFFTKYLFHYFKYISRTKKLGFLEKAGLYFYVFKKWISSKKYHLVKYDLRLHKPIQWLKQSFKRKGK